MSPQTLVDNVMAIAENAVPKIPRKWANIQVVALKTPESMSLPIYNKTPETLLEIAAMAGYNPPKPSTSEDIDLAEREFNSANNKSKDSKADADKKRKGDMKSPLVRALKKQKQVEEEEKVTKKADKKEASKQKRVVADVAVEDTPKESPTKKQKKQVTKKVEEVKAVAKKVEEVKPESAKKGKKETKVKEVTKKVEEVKPESAKKTKKETKVETPKDTKKQKKETSAKKSPVVKPKSAEKPKKEEANTDFIAAKKFKGSKKGYAFKMGKQGVGYYVDVKPTVDKMAIAAIMRLKNSRGSQKKGKYGR